MKYFTTDEATTRQLRKSALATIATLSLFLGMFGLGCSFTVDTKELNEGDDGITCGSDEKKCPVDSEDPDGPKECVDSTAPQFGCKRTSCQPCELDGAVPRCTPSGDCGISTCKDDNLDCNGAVGDGCEVDSARDPDNCGGCGNPDSGANICVIPNASRTCVGGKCAIAVCLSGFKDCNNQVNDGCEVNVNTSTEHCGACNTPCAGECVDGECM